MIKNRKIKQGEKIMVVSEVLAKEIEELSKKMNTSQLDVICSALELLKNSINKEVILKEPDSNRQNIITALKRIKLNKNV